MTKFASAIRRGAALLDLGIKSVFPATCPRGGWLIVFRDRKEVFHYRGKLMMKWPGREPYPRAGGDPHCAVNDP
ncbi:MAG: hypothetical protein WA005_14955 [Candidatus Binataceae bacterium]